MQIGWAPVEDGRADPGEVVWAWVPFEEDPQQGKDRPVLVLGRQGDTLLALQLTSRDHDEDQEQEASEGRLWTDVGTGAWDRYRRPSEVRVNRLLRLPGSAVRRTGASIDRAVFERVLDEAAGHLPALALSGSPDASPPGPPSDGPTPTPPSPPDR
ncbi:MAG TPA: type II toxin-antitoxin system PemK/MazF family toxin [Ornithinimicrobium sp.]|nr:type II toxin-antitoxin system PemK/MazF family toxin [Ornithinimicrobium sp.]